MFRNAGFTFSTVQTRPAWCTQTFIETISIDTSSSVTTGIGQQTFIYVYKGRRHDSVFKSQTQIVLPYIERGIQRLMQRN